MNNKIKIFIIILSIIVVGGIGAGVYFFAKSTNNGQNQAADNNVNGSSNAKEQTNKNNKYVYASSLSEKQKNDIINECKGNYTLTETLNINKEITGYYYGYDNRHLFINKIMKFENTNNSGNDKIVVDFIEYGNTGSYAPDSWKMNLVDTNGNAIDKTSISHRNGYPNVGEYEGMPQEYKTETYTINLGYYKLIEHSAIREEIETRLSGYWYYDVEDASKINLNDLYVYYNVENKNENIYKINNSEYDTLYQRMKLEPSNDYVPTNANMYFVNNRNETKMMKTSLNSQTIYNKNGERINSDIISNTVTFSEYRVEKWNGKDVLIVPYKLNKLEDKEGYSEYYDFGHKTVYLLDKDGKLYIPIELNNHMKNEMYDVSVDNKLEAVYILPDDYDLNSMYFTFKQNVNIFTNDNGVPLDTLTKVEK